MVAWLAAGLEGLDDEHAAATAGARWASTWPPPDRFRPPLRPQARPDQELALARSFGAVRASKQAVMADAMEAFGQHVDEKRRMNSPASSVIVVYRPGPSIL